MLKDSRHRKDTPMHAQVLKHRPPNRYVGLALAIGLAASLTLSAVMLSRSSDDGASATAPQANISLLEKEQRYYDAKMARIEAMEAAAGAQYVPAAESYAGPHQGALDVDQWLAEQRAASAATEQLVESPRLHIGAQAAKPQSSERMKYLEWNIAPGDIQPMLPPYSEHLEVRH
jgi:hypothetical protein